MLCAASNMAATWNPPAGERKCVSAGAGSGRWPRPLLGSLWSRGRAGFEHPWPARREAPELWLRRQRLGPPSTWPALERYGRRLSPPSSLSGGFGPARSSPPRLRFPCVLSVSFHVQLHPARPHLGWLCASHPVPQPRPRAVLHTPTLALASPAPSLPVPGLTRCPIRDPSRPLGPHPVSEGVSSLSLRFSVPFPVPPPHGQTSPRSLLSQSLQLLCASPALFPSPGPWLALGALRCSSSLPVSHPILCRRMFTFSPAHFSLSLFVV